MFDFRIIETPDGNQIIRDDLKTPYSALTPFQFAEYTYIDNQLEYLDRMEKKEAERLERQRRLARNPIYKIACFCGLV